MTEAVLAVLAGLVLLVWSADRFVDGAAAAARHFGMSPLLIGMVVVGFGTSAPEMTVSVLAALQNNPGIALGNAYGSNIANIALILGVTALVSPIAVHSRVLDKELPLLMAATLLSAGLLWDGAVSRIDALVLLVMFGAVMGWSIRQGLRAKDDALGQEFEKELREQAMPLRVALFWLAAGLAMLIASSQLLVWGAVEIAKAFGISDLVIGLTIVAVGTSLPELASSLIATRKGEHDIALGNVLGSNLFNTLAVVGLAGVIAPVSVGEDIFTRDMLVMGALTVLLFFFSRGLISPNRISRPEGGILLASYAAYTAWLLMTAI